ncbi:hypothetical protein BCR39DRAFT_537734 [Naematelia encephala]|uniref:FAD/NAD(P)-binding domain-containing protein n=1 Tax=Naematelia encephala TaxID=71784 RepID=A0A1Y2AYV3_9TREE|nr:hypothetical protein BCR39DRAFT_537734 [Naematelia encephala]
MACTRVAIIGGGASGLVQLKQLLDTFARRDVTRKLEVILYESRSEIGGTWLCETQPKGYQRVNTDEQVYFQPPKGQDPSPMYFGLRTNLPYDLMSFRDFSFPEGTTLFPDQPTVLAYLQVYARHFNLLPHIRFNTRVDRLYRADDRWSIESTSSSRSGSELEHFDFVSIANGHYSDVWVPPVPDLSSFPGEMLHSRFYLRPEEYAGRTVLVVGSFASGSDLSRQIGGLNIGRYTSDGRPLTPVSGSESGFTKVYVSASGAPTPQDQGGESSQPWRQFVTNVPLISHVERPSDDYPKGRIHFQPGQTNTEPIEVDTIIFATGYNFSLPFCKVTDEPWKSHKLLDRVITKEERDNGASREQGGLKGLGVHGLDETMIFLDGDRSLAFLTLQYQVVPFPLAEVQARLASMLWAGLLPSFPVHPALPPNPTNPYFTPPPTPGTSTPSTDLDGHAVAQVDKPIRKVLKMRQKLVFGAPYEWTYEEWLMGLMIEGYEEGVGEEWRRIEDWRRARRNDATLRFRTLGY